MTEWLYMDLRQPPERFANLPRGEHDRDPLDREAASREPQGLRRRAIEPLGIVDQAEEAVLPGRLRQQPEHRERHEKGIRCRPRTTPKRDIQCLVLRTRQALTEREDRRAELLDTGERELHLPLDPGAAHDPHVRRLRDRVVQQRCLADAGFAVHDERAAAPVAGRLHQPAQGRSLAIPTQQLHSR